MLAGYRLLYGNNRIVDSENDIIATVHHYRLAEA